MDLRAVSRVMAFSGVLIVAGCASESHAHSAQSICEAAGGTYAQGTCQPGTAKSGREICEKMGARWVEALGVCEFPGKGKG